MVLAGAVILPHGTLPFDNPESLSSDCQSRANVLDADMKNKFYSIYKGSLAAAEEISQCDPDLILLHTPHGITTSDSLCIYGNPSADGNAEWNNAWSEFQVSIEMDSVIAERLYGYLMDRQVKAEHLSVFAGLSCPLRWGEVVPIWYLSQKLKKPPKFVIMTHPRKLGTGQVEIEKLNVGRLISDFIMTLPADLKVVVAISADLSHTYSTSCINPLYLPLPNSKLSTKVNNEAAQSFARAILGWVKSLPDISSFNSNAPLPEGLEHWNPGNAMSWISKAAMLHTQALSCGMTGFMLLHGLLAGYVAKGRIFVPKIHVVEAPTYYGMMAVTFLTKMN